MVKIWHIGVIWGLVVFAYIIYANVFTVFTGLTDSAGAALQATSNMSNYPGTLEAVQSAPLWGWFVPGGVGIVATAVYLIQEKGGLTGG